MARERQARVSVPPESRSQRLRLGVFAIDSSCKRPFSKRLQIYIVVSEDCIDLEIENAKRAPEVLPI